MNASAANAELKRDNKSVRVSVAGFFCLAAILALGFALQISHGFLNWRALVAVSTAILFCILALVLPASTLLLPFRASNGTRLAFFVLLIGYCFAGIFFLRSRHPSIDVLVIENDSLNTFLHGGDPYGKDVTHRDIYKPDQKMYGPGIEVNGRVRVGFQYPPLTLFWMLPGYLLGDVRYSFLAALVLTGIAIFYCEPNLNGLVATALLWCVPNPLFIVEYGWTEPLMLLCLAATVLAARKAPYLIPAAFGMFLASKQYALLGLPLAGLLLPRFSWKAYLSLLFKAVAFAAIVTVPFLAWDPVGFWSSLVMFHVLAPLRLDALSWSAMLVTHGLSPIPAWCVLVAVCCAAAMAVWKGHPGGSDFSISVALVSLCFFLFGKQAFANYYFFCCGSLCLGLVLAGENAGDEFVLVRNDRREPRRLPAG